jgi:hypothetical protein
VKERRCRKRGDIDSEIHKCTSKDSYAFKSGSVFVLTIQVEKKVLCFDCCFLPFLPSEKISNIYSTHSFPLIS